MEKLYRYLPYFFTSFFVLVVYCFYATYFGHFPDFEGIKSTVDKKPLPITAITHFHATMVVLWLLMLIVQPILIVNKKLDWHRLLGKASYLVVGLLFISMILVIRQEQLREKNLIVFNVNLFDMPVFIVLYGLAIYHRKTPAYHSRFMIMSILPFLSPALGRIQVESLPVQLGLWILFFVIEFFTRKTYKPYLIGFGYYFANLAFAAYLALANQPLLNRIWHFFF